MADSEFKQQGRGWMKYPARGTLLRAFYKLPLLEWRMGLGPVLRRLGFVVLTTRGRKSGLPRHTVLEHTVFRDRVYLAPGWGERTQWYQNLIADPRVTIQRGVRPESAVAQRVTDNLELASLYIVMRGRSPVWKQYLESWGVEDTLDDFIAKKDRLIVVRLDPCSDPTLPGVKKDLVWFWPLLAAVSIAGWLIARG